MEFNIEKVYPSTIDSKFLLPYQLEIWRYQLGFYVDLGQKFCNPFRSDKTPGCWLYEYNGIIHLADFGDRNFHGITMFHTINETNFQKKCQYIYYEILPKINVPLDQLFYQNTSKKKKKRVKLSWQTREFSRPDREFWFHGGINLKQLKSENLNAIKSYQVNDSTIYCKDLAYAYHIEDGKKVYRPYNKQYKWTSNMTNKHVGGNKIIQHERFRPKSIIITKSLKDYCVICNMEYNCRYIINEGADLTPAFLNYLDKNFDFVFFCMDNDKAGKKAVVKYQELWNNFIGNSKFYSLNIPEYDNITDVFDFAKNKSFSEIENIISEQIENIFDGNITTDSIPF